MNWQSAISSQRSNVSLQRSANGVPPDPRGRLAQTLGLSMTATLVTTILQGEAFAHRIRWISCQRQLAAARTMEKGNWYFHLPAMLIAFMTFEA